MDLAQALADIARHAETARALYEPIDSWLIDDGDSLTPAEREQLSAALTWLAGVHERATRMVLADLPSRSDS